MHCRLYKQRYRDWFALSNCKRLRQMPALSRVTLASARLSRLCSRRSACATVKGRSHCVRRPTSYVVVQRRTTTYVVARRPATSYDVVRQRTTSTSTYDVVRRRTSLRTTTSYDVVPPRMYHVCRLMHTNKKLLRMTVTMSFWLLVVICMHLAHFLVNIDKLDHNAAGSRHAASSRWLGWICTSRTSAGQ